MQYVQYHDSADAKFNIAKISIPEILINMFNFRALAFLSHSNNYSDLEIK